MYFALLKKNGKAHIRLNLTGLVIDIKRSIFGHYLLKHNKSFLFFLIPILNSLRFSNKLIYISNINVQNLMYMELIKTFMHNSTFYHFRLFKFHGINMRIILLKNLPYMQLLYLRLAFSHGILIYLPKTVLIKIFKKRYLLLATFDQNYLNNLTFNLKFFKKFFRYKLIGVKLVRDIIKIKSGKKKTI